MTCYCGQQFSPTPDTRLRCPLCRASKAALRRGPGKLDYLSRLPAIEVARTLKLPLQIVLSDEATGIAKLRAASKQDIPKFGGRTLPTELQRELQAFRGTIDRLLAAGLPGEAARVKEIIDNLEARVRDITSSQNETDRPAEDVCQTQAGGSHQ